MQFERPNGRGEDLAAELSFRCRNPLRFSPSRPAGFLCLGRGASAPPNRRHARGGEGGGKQEDKKAPSVIALVVSQYQKNSRVWEKTYPGCRACRTGGPGGEGGCRRGSEQVPDGRGGRSRAGGGGGARRPESHRRGLREGRFLPKFHLGAALTPISKTNPSPRPGRTRCSPPWTPPPQPPRKSPARVRRRRLGGLRGGGRRGRGGGQGPGPPSLRAEGGCGGLPFPALPGALPPISSSPRPPDPA